MKLFMGKNSLNPQGPVENRTEVIEKSKSKTYQKRFYRKRVELFLLIEKIKLWPSRKGVLHGIKSVERVGHRARITTHCNKTFWVNNSRNGRAARCLRNQRYQSLCPICQVPEWKERKYASTRFRRHQGSSLQADGIPSVYSSGKSEP